MAHVVQILIAPSPTAAMECRQEIQAVPNHGLEGDRYFSGTGTFSRQPQKPDFELTLIESEAIEAFVRESGLPLTAEDVRRNLVTRGIRLNDLVGLEFSIGTVRIKGMRLCEPCAYLAKKTRPEVLSGLVRRGGLRAQILSAGLIRSGEAIRVESTRPPGRSGPQGS